MYRIGYIGMVVVALSARAQPSNKYLADEAPFYRAEALFEKNKFSAAQNGFRQFVRANRRSRHPYLVRAAYCDAICALRLHHSNAEQLLLRFLKRYPESTYRTSIYLELGNHYYDKQKYGKTIKWLSKVTADDLPEDEKPAYYFKLGQAYFNQKKITPARDAFHEIIDKESVYQHPALYYYAHIAYTRHRYATALKGFEQLEDDSAFSAAIPVYKTHILHRQTDYEGLLAYALPALKRKPNYSGEIAHLTGDALYRLGRYKEALPFLKVHSDRYSTNREEDYRLGYTYYKCNQYKKAIPLLDKVARTADQLGQVALYHIGDCYLKTDHALAARNAFELAAEMTFDPQIAETSLYQYALLSYQLDFNPFDEAIKAFHRYLNRYPDSDRREDMYRYLVNVYTTTKSYTAALAFLEKVEDMNFTLKSAYQLIAFNKAVELFNDKAFESSKKHFQKALLYPLHSSLNALSHYWRAAADYQLGNYDAAIAAYRAFLNVPNSYTLAQHNDGYYHIAYCYFKAERYPEAIQHFRTFIQDPKERANEKIADACLRIGDAYFVQKQDEEAIAYYRKAIEEKAGQADYAQYQIGLAHGFAGAYDRKADAMRTLFEQYPTSTFAVPALYEAAEAYRLMDSQHYDEAIRYYRQIVTDHAQHPKAIDAVFQIASLYFIQEKYALAEQHYVDILQAFNDPLKKKEALARLKDIYTVTHQAEKYIALVEQLDGGLNTYEKDSLLYFNALHLYEDSLYRQAISSFEAYLSTFSPPLFSTEAHYFKGTAHCQLEEVDQCYTHYTAVLQQPTSRYTEFAALTTARYAYDRQNYTAAIPHYEQLVEVATYPENKLRAQIGLMRSHTLLGQFAAARPYARRVIDDPLALEQARLEGHYVLGKAAVEDTSYDTAIAAFKTVAQNTQSSMGAEAQYTIALIHHLQGDYATSESEIRWMMKEQTSDDYQTAKALLLQAKNSMAVDDYVQAEYTLNSLLNGYPTKDDGIVDEVTALLATLQQLKNPAKAVVKDTVKTIEIQRESP